MIVFCDTSALVKLFVEEEHSQALRAVVNTSMAVAVSRLAWAEVMSALARRAREVPDDSAVVATARRAFVERWADLVVVGITQPVVEMAGDYAEAFALRAGDSIQLASLQTLRVQAQAEIRFACFDARLVKAAAVLGTAGAL